MFTNSQGSRGWKTSQTIGTFKVKVSMSQMYNQRLNVCTVHVLPLSNLERTNFYQVLIFTILNISPIACTFVEKENFQKHFQLHFQLHLHKDFCWYLKPFLTPAINRLKVWTKDERKIVSNGGYPLKKL